MTSDANLTGVLRQLRSRAGDAAPDGELLARYAARHDQDAFAAVVHRYGGLVLGVARRQLADAAQADDVYQATFLALARSAERVGTATPLANWLYTVARRQARKARARAFRRAEAELGGDGRVLVRPSGTEPKIRLMIQARDAALAERVVGQLAEEVRRALAGQ